MSIRPEIIEDVEGIRRVNTAAFGRPAEANLVAALRDNGKALLSLVALREGRIVGHILFSPVTIQGENGTHEAIGLGPMAVMPQMQRSGIGSELVRAGLEQLRKAGHGSVIVLGHPEFYVRFGFGPASGFGVRTTYHVPDEVFMAVELREGELADKAGVVVYSPEFDEV